ncbi:MAG: 8-oxo-dGTP diphosphatase MutT [Phycisphaerales bacterium]|nr:8-oxo-dGTP diphosphatase MutT [Phycisphaerales bacterium]
MNSTREQIFLHVVVGIVTGADGTVLITRRPDDVHQGGLWEFPGGKVEHGESTMEALGRELHEELGIMLRAAEPLLQVDHAYPDRRVLLDVWRVTDFQGEPHGREGQPLVWVSLDEIERFAFPAADAPIVAALRARARQTA